MSKFDFEQYRAAASASTSKKMGKVAGFGAVVATGLLSASQAEADIVFLQGFTGVATQASAGFAVDIDGDGNNDIFLGMNDLLPGTAGTADSNGGFLFAGTGTKGGFAFQGNGAAFPSPYQQAASSGTVSFGNVNDAPANGVGWMGWVSSGASTSDAWGVFNNEGATQTGLIGFQFNGSSINGNANATMNAWIQISMLWDDDAVNAANGVIEGGELFVGIQGIGFQNDPTSVDNGQLPDGTGFTGTAGGIHLGAVANAVPEPSSAALALLALGAIGVRRRKEIASTAA